MNARRLLETATDLAPSGAGSVLLVLTCLAADRESAGVSVNQMVADTGLSRRSVYRQIDLIVDAGLLGRGKRVGSNGETHYVLNDAARERFDIVSATADIAVAPQAPASETDLATDLVRLVVGQLDEAALIDPVDIAAQTITIYREAFAGADLPAAALQAFYSQAIRAVVSRCIPAAADADLHNFLMQASQDEGRFFVGLQSVASAASSGSTVKNWASFLMGCFRKRRDAFERGVPVEQLVNLGVYS